VRIALRDADPARANVADETFDIGQDTRTPLALVEYRYDVPFKFTGKIDKLTFELDPGQSGAKP